jgi:hypothetical protein
VPDRVKREARCSFELTQVLACDGDLVSPVAGFNEIQIGAESINPVVIGTRKSIPIQLMEGSGREHPLRTWEFGRGSCGIAWGNLMRSIVVDLVFVVVDRGMARGRGRIRVVRRSLFLVWRVLERAADVAHGFAIGSIGKYDRPGDRFALFSRHHPRSPGRNRMMPV